jgi:hypothetical protein
LTNQDYVVCKEKAAQEFFFLIFFGFSLIDTDMLRSIVDFLDLFDFTTVMQVAKACESAARICWENKKQLKLSEFSHFLCQEFQLLLHQRMH